MVFCFRGGQRGRALGSDCAQFNRICVPTMKDLVRKIEILFKLKYLVVKVLNLVAKISVWVVKVKIININQRKLSWDFPSLR
jgi:hypothetical protein